MRHLLHISFKYKAVQKLNEHGFFVFGESFNFAEFRQRRSTCYLHLFAIFEFKCETMVTIIKKGTSPTEIRRKIEKALKGKRKMSIMDFAGCLKSDIDPLAFQKKIRDEWA